MTIYLRASHQNNLSLVFLGIGETIVVAENALLISMFQESKFVESVTSPEDMHTMFKLIISSFPQIPREFVCSGWHFVYAKRN